jgi:hypothetical protein
MSAQRFEHEWDRATSYEWPIRGILKQRSQEGWELVSVVREDKDTHLLFFKRPLSNTNENTTLTRNNESRINENSQE